MAARANSIRSDDLLHGLMLLVRGCEEKMIRVPRWALAAFDGAADAEDDESAYVRSYRYVRHALHSLRDSR